MFSYHEFGQGFFMEQDELRPHLWLVGRTLPGRIEYYPVCGSLDWARAKGRKLYNQWQEMEKQRAIALSNMKPLLSVGTIQPVGEDEPTEEQDLDSDDFLSAECMERYTRRRGIVA